ncbi:aldehyde dehydrogenase family protein [Salinigranum marinum]|uniref:aldehyde dehydrogenase family protein n=1 Tax=Salinigranum marinum TaxID=1515595 RepID=UPI002989B8A5|nr:aldehyde dehydrogenase family protein [Salinigranum marinum]
MSDREQRDAIRERHRAARRRALDGLTVASWIDGRSVGDGDTADPDTDVTETRATRDPVIDEPIVEVPVATADTVDAAVTAAQATFDDEWGATTPRERSHRLHEWTDVLSDHVDELTLLESLDTGKPIAEARGEVEGAIDTLEYYASACRVQTGEQIPAGSDLHMYTRTEPFGVVGQITPWNFPAWAAAWKLGPALAAGNCSVLKPSAHAPLTTIRMAQLSTEVLPDGVCNVVTGPGSTTGSALVEHDGVRKLSFTGSGDVGTEVMRTVASRLAPVTLELGGKSPFVVFPDADLDTVVEAVADGIYYSTGEICDALSRALVHEDVYDEFVARFVEQSRSYVLGDPLDEETTMGPLTTADQFETVTEYVDVGLEAGATLATGGGTPDDGALKDGHYVEPTVFTDVDNDMRIAREEIFGPVQTVQSFATYEEAIELANDTPFGLAAGIGSESSDLIHHAAADIEAGVVYVNAYGPIRPEGPYGGFKQSGIGRDLGEEALTHYRQTKTVYVNLDEPSV